MKREQLVEQLRSEVINVKDCFTRFSFQTIAISIPILGIIENFQKEFPELSLCSLLIMIFSLTVAKIGCHKYTTANRNLGFLLFQERHAFLPPTTCYIFRNNDEIAWEEAMRAWRIVQATVFQHIYKIHPILPNYLSIKCDNEYRWFDAKKIAEDKEVFYYPGSYLRNMHLLLFFISFVALIPPIHASIILLHHLSNFYDYLKLYIIIGCTSLGTLYYFWRVWRLTIRRKILEHGLLSIQSSAILWEAVVVAYNLALLKSLESSFNKKQHPLRDFASNLAEISKELKEKKNICHFYSWLSQKRGNLKKLAQQLGAVDRQSAALLGGN